ncbi:hypothetical protein L6452_14250 [Arctium lappa]|uniref:Uncharacterized protein n=1 Tax=Arctium lappa TaxID=4217 RepID=A0ACB9CKK6_ARCLA|nr:hypothetical protein L6452_14250 [Arctium lappa]
MSVGCQHKQPLRCGSGEGFRKILGVKFPDTRHSWYNVSMTLDECEMACTRDCSCTTFAQLDIRNGGSGCLLWFDELMDIREYGEKQEIYVRMAASELTGNWNALDKKDTSVQMEDLDVTPFFSLYEIAKATENFSVNNKIGEDGFGPVYKLIAFRYALERSIAPLQHEKSELNLANSIADFVAATIGTNEAND